jgi:hypothetical protein
MSIYPTFDAAFYQTVGMSNISTKRSSRNPAHYTANDSTIK